MHFAHITFGPDSMDELTRLELLVAKRADELWRLTRGERPDRELWQQAEAEILAQGQSRQTAAMQAKRRMATPL